MTHTYSIKQALGVLAGLVLFTGASQAGLYHVTINTSALNAPANASSAPYSLDVQLNSGTTLNNNTATLSNFSFGGGGAPFGAANVSGGVTGSLAAGTVTLHDVLPFNEFFQSFRPGNVLGFDLSLTQNIDAGPTPDGFSVAILDANLFNIPTTGFADTLLFANIASTRPVTITQLNLASGTGTFSAVSAAAAAVPEPATLTLLVFGLVGLAVRRRGAATDG